MKNNIDCRIVQDLLPLYVDGLTNEYTTNVIEACLYLLYDLLIVRHSSDFQEALPDQLHVLLYIPIHWH